MSAKWIGRGLLIAIAILIFIAAGGQVVLHLWNWLLPSLLGVRTITFWQAVGLLALCRLLFGGFGPRPLYRSGFRRRMAERFENMTPEEREKFRRGMRGGCGPFGPAAPDTKA